ncbi:hypothetical protein H0W91_01725 [Patescibacteria group bacterium]|nr:hypothetical protein [Patescibacteria group bacterium]
MQTITTPGEITSILVGDLAKARKLVRITNLGLSYGSIFKNTGSVWVKPAEPFFVFK